MPPAEFEPAIPTTERLQILALDRWATGIGSLLSIIKIKLTIQKETNSSVFRVVRQRRVN
jgi:hypothetical protein